MNSDSTTESKASMTGSCLPRVPGRLRRAGVRRSRSGLSAALARFLTGAARQGCYSTTLVVGAVAVALAAGCSATPFGARFAPVREGETVADRAGVNDPEALSAIQEFLERTAEYGIEGSAAESIDTAVTTAPRGAADAPSIVPPGLPTGSEPMRANAPIAETVFVEAAPALALPVVGFVSISPVADAEPEAVAADPVPPAPNSVNMPLDAQGAQRPTDLASVVPHLLAQAEASEDFDAAWRLRLTQLALHRDDEAAQLAPNLPGGEILAALMRTASAVRRVARDPSGPGDQAVTSVQALSRLLAARADPRVTTIHLCRKVVTFGVYEEMIDTEFVAGRTVRTIVYTELRNLQSERTDDGQFRTRLATRVEVLSIDGESVWTEEEPEIVDLCRVPRTDFFIAQRISLPPTLPAGDYVLKVLVEDKLSGKADEGTRAFSINSQFSIAHGG